MSEGASKSEKVKGQASYFPSIEKTYKHPIEHWKAIVRSSGLTKHLEMVKLLKEQYGMGHGHANAIVAHTVQEDGR